MEKPRKLKISNQAEGAAGACAVISSLAHLYSYTGVARGLKILGKMNQKQGFDCPGCAWPDPDQERSSLGEYCENGAKAIAEECTTRRVTDRLFAETTLTELQKKSDFWLGKQGRITKPYFKAKNQQNYQPISWDAAFKLIGQKLRETSAKRALFYTSGRASNEAAYSYQLMVRMHGSNNLPDCSNLCHESSGAALTKSIGIGKGTVTLNDFQKAAVILIVGQNPGTNHPRMLSSLREAALGGAHIVSINPLKEAGLMEFKHPQKIKDLLSKGVPIAKNFLQVHINGDMALFRGLSKALVQHHPEAINSDFINNKTLGFENYKRILLD